MKILIVSPEAHPYFRTGGLGDVAGSLARSLARRGHDVRVAMPRYRSLGAGSEAPRVVLPEILVDVEGASVIGSVEAVEGEVTTYFVRCDRYFDREGAYGELVAGQLRDYPDNVERFAFFCMAVLWMMKGLGWRPDVIHCNDWQAALVPVYLRTHEHASSDPFYRPLRVLFSIHNLAFQGRASRAMLPRVGLGPNVDHMEGLEFHGGINLMKGGVVYSDYITTVSPRYAKEIQTAELGCGLDGVLRKARRRMSGILNGIDTSEWDPETDARLPANYSIDDLSGKAVCKRVLQGEMGLPVRPDAPLIGMVSRLSTQKGLEVVDASLTRLVEMGCQLVVLGDGEPRYHWMLERMARKYPRNVSVRLGFDDTLAHRIEAGGDLFLMPSYYEPCGLNQMYSMRYGTPPVVRRTGGLADSVVGYKAGATNNGAATGFVFGPYDPAALTAAVRRAVRLYEGDPTEWRNLMRNAMRRDSSWATVALEYERVYGRVLSGWSDRPDGVSPGV